MHKCREIFHFRVVIFQFIGRLRNARHWDWLGQALEAGFLRGQPPPIEKGTPPSKEQLLLERRQRLQGKTEPQVRDLPGRTFA